VHGSLKRFAIGERLNINNESEIIEKLTEKGGDFIGLEDPDVWIDEAGLTHLYFTIPIRRDDKTLIHLGHAVGENLDSLEMTMPVLMNVAKEVCIAPRNTKGFRYNLVESRDKTDTYSTVRVAIAKEMGKSWKYGETVFNPNDHDIPWIAAHASPGPLFPATFVDVGAGKSLGVMNGRATGAKGAFTIGLFLYDYERGKIEWVSSSPLIQDSEAKTITFASQFVETGSGEGVLYAHIDDSFVRSYALKASDSEISFRPLKRAG